MDDGKKGNNEGWDGRKVGGGGGEREGSETND